MTPSIAPLWERLAEGQRALAAVRASYDEDDAAPQLYHLSCGACARGETSARAIAIHNSRCAAFGERLYRGPSRSPAAGA